MKNTWMTKDWTVGELNALVKKLGEENARKILTNDFTVEIKEAVKKLFDKNGRLIPPVGLQSKVYDPDKNFYLDQPEMKTASDFQKRLNILYESLGIKKESETEWFMDETEILLKRIRANSQIANILNSVWLPIILPKFQYDDLGEELERLLTAVEKSYKKAFSDRTFKIHLTKGDLKNKVKVRNGHEKLIDELKTDFVYGIYFPNLMQGYSIKASREISSTISEGFSLSGIDGIIGMIMYPDILARDYHTPGLDLSGLEWQSAAGYSLYFEADDDDLTFGDTGGLFDVNVSFSSGLFFS